MMDFPLLSDPLVLNGVLQQVAPSENFLGLKIMGSGTPHPFPTFSEEVTRSSRYVATFNSPNAEATMVGEDATGFISGKFLYTRIKEQLQGTVLKWMRTPGTYERRQAENKIAEVLAKLNGMMDRQMEYTFWQTAKGGIITLTIGGATVTIDFGMLNTHKPTASVEWDHTASGVYDADIMSDLQTWRQLIIDDGQVNPRTIIVSTNSFQYIAKNGIVKDLLTDARKNELFSTGQLKSLLGFDWILYDDTYMTGDRTVTKYVPDGKLIMCDISNTWELLLGPSPDASAPDNTYGKFAKSWESNDPSGRTVLTENSWFPFLRHPNNVVYATIYT